MKGRSARHVVIGCICIVGCTALTAGEAAAGGPLGDNGETIETSRYAIDLFQGPVYSGSRAEVGLLYRPNDQPFRLGVAFRSAIETQPSYSKTLLPDTNGDVTIARGGTAEEAVGVDSFLSQLVNRSGREVVYSPRVVPSPKSGRGS